MCMALGVPFDGIEVPQGRVLYVTRDMGAGAVTFKIDVTTSLLLSTVCATYPALRKPLLRGLELSR